MKPRKTERRNILDYRSWTEAETFILRRTYPSGGNLATREALARAGYKRSADSINARAKHEGIMYQASPERKGTHVRLVIVESEACGNGSVRVSSRALRMAKKDGVILREKVHPFAYLVPVEWAEAYVNKIAEYDAEARHKLATWWRNHRVAQEFRITEDHLSVAKRYDTPLGRAIRTIPHRVYEMNGYEFRRVRLWEPTAAVKAAATYLNWLENSPQAEWARFCKMREAIKKVRREAARVNEE